MTARTIFFSLLCAGLALSGTRAPAAADNSPGVLLTNSIQIRSLPHSEASHRRSAKLRGVSVGEAEPDGRGFAIQDATGGIYVESSPGTVAHLHAGDLVEVEGITDPGQFAPFVRASRVQTIGRTELPAPRRVTYEELVAGHLDAQWVEISGIVRQCSPSPNDARKCRLELATGGERLIVRLNVPNPKAPLVDAEVVLRGVCYYLVNKNRQSLSPMLAVSRDVPVLVKVPAPADPFASPVRPVGSLLQFEPEGSYGHRVRVHGVVTRFQPGEFLFIREGALGLRIATPQRDELKPGDEVDVLGFPKQGEYSASLEDAVFRLQSHGAPPSPVHLARAADAFDHDCDLVELDATLGERQTTAYESVLTLRAGDGKTFNAMLRSNSIHSLLPAWETGSRIRASGVCNVRREYSGLVSGLSHPQSFELLLRSPADLTLIQPPPWWTRQRVLWMSGALAAISLLTVGGVVMHARKRLREQASRRAMAEAEFSAIFAERNRIAREIHDTLAQGLGGISIQLECMKSDLKNPPEEVTRHLDLARTLVRGSLADARRAIWEMRSQSLEDGDLRAALEGVLRQLTDGSGVEARFETVGASRRLAPLAENALLHIGQESLANAVRHAHAKRIETRLEFGDRQVRLSVKDDGCGFDPSGPPTNGGGFGLLGMRERVDRLRGELLIRSSPGAGTEINVTIPAAA